MNYNKINILFNRSANKTSRAYVYDDCYAYKESDNSITIRFRDLNLITYYPDNTFSCDSNGDRTNRVKNKINYFLPLGESLHNRKGQWKWKNNELFVDKEIKQVKSIRDLYKKPENEHPNYRKNTWENQ